MNPMPPEFVAQWLPRWRQLAEVARAAAEAPESDSLANSLQDLADSAAGDHRHVGAWPSPFGQKRDQYAGAALLWLAKAYGRQGTAPMRHTLAGALGHLALAFTARLERAAAVLEGSEDHADAVARAVSAAFVPLRRRRDIDDMDED